jgi:TrmH family RNA methyltransferase
VELALISDRLEAEAVTALCRERVGRVVPLPEPELAQWAATRNPQGVVLLVQRLPEPDPESPVPDPFVLVLDRVAEPGNLGTILRTAWAVGLQQVWLTRGCADAFEAKAVRAGMGAQFNLGLRAVADLSEAGARLSRHGIAPVWLTTPGRGLSLYDAAFDLAGAALVIGNEAWGVGGCPGAREVRIPMPGTAESLNAAQAATLFLFEAVRRGVCG